MTTERYDDPEPDLPDMGWRRESARRVREEARAEVERLRDPEEVARAWLDRSGPPPNWRDWLTRPEAIAESWALAREADPDVTYDPQFTPSEHDGVLLFNCPVCWPTATVRTPRLDVAEGKILLGGCPAGHSEVEIGEALLKGEPTRVAVARDSVFYLDKYVHDQIEAGIGPAVKAALDREHEERQRRARRSGATADEWSHYLRHGQWPEKGTRRGVTDEDFDHFESTGRWPWEDEQT